MNGNSVNKSIFYLCPLLHLDVNMVALMAMGVLLLHNAEKGRGLASRTHATAVQGHGGATPSLRPVARTWFAVGCRSAEERQQPILLLLVGARAKRSGQRAQYGGADRTCRCASLRGSRP
jgi:hypothetical protein